MLSKVREIHEQSKGSYGSRRMSKRLRELGYDVGRHRARSLMNKAKLSYRRRKKYRRTTDSKHNFPVAENLLERNFTANAANTVWCSDITYLWTMEGWLYLAVVMDLYSRKIVGWASSSSLKTSLVKEALTMAYWQRKPGKGLIHHSDRGRQYASYAYQALLRRYEITPSMSRSGNCYDNAYMESFFGTLKRELVYGERHHTREEARLSIFEYVEVFYNRIRRHSALGYRSPEQYELLIET